MPRRRPATALEQRSDETMVQRIREYHEWGREIQAICEREHVTSDEAIARLGRSESRSTGYKAREFGEWSPADVAYVVADGRRGRPLSWSHVIALLSVNDVRERRRLMRQAVRNGWSAARLRSEMRPGDNRRRNSGRRFQGLDHPDEFFRALEGYLERPQRFINQALQAESLSLSSAQRRRLRALMAAIQAVTPH